MIVQQQPTGGTGSLVTLNAHFDPPSRRTLPDRTELTRSLSDELGSPAGLELTSSCTHALEAAITVLGIGPGDEVVVPAFTFPSTANAALLRGATIRFADVDHLSGNLDPGSLERLINRRTRAVICTHYGGVACDMAALADLCGRGGPDLVEDAAHGTFAYWNGHALGTLGRLGALSFHHTKNLSAGDGGAIVVNDPQLVGPVRCAIDKGTNRVNFEEGRVRSYEWVGPGSAWRMPDPAVETLAVQWQLSDDIQRVRHHAWSRYHGELTAWAERVGARLPHVPASTDHPAHLYWVLLPPRVDRARFVQHCAMRGVEVARHFGSLPASRYGRSVRHPDDVCPVAERFGTSLVRLPLHHQLNDHDIDRVVDAVTSFPAS